MWSRFRDTEIPDPLQIFWGSAEVKDLMGANERYRVLQEAFPVEPPEPYVLDLSKKWSTKTLDDHHPIPISDRKKSLGVCSNDPRLWGSKVDWEPDWKDIWDSANKKFIKVRIPDRAEVSMVPFEGLIDHFRAGFADRLFAYAVKLVEVYCESCVIFSVPNVEGQWICLDLRTVNEEGSSAMRVWRKGLGWMGADFYLSEYPSENPEGSFPEDFQKAIEDYEDAFIDLAFTESEARATEDFSDLHRIPRSSYHHTGDDFTIRDFLRGIACEIWEAYRSEEEVKMNFRRRIAWTSVDIFDFFERSQERKKWLENKPEDEGEPYPEDPSIQHKKEDLLKAEQRKQVEEEREEWEKSFSKEPPDSYLEELKGSWCSSLEVAARHNPMPPPEESSDEV